MVDKPVMEIAGGEGRRQRSESWRQGSEGLLHASEWGLDLPGADQLQVQTAKMILFGTIWMMVRVGPFRLKV